MIRFEKCCYHLVIRLQRNHDKFLSHKTNENGKTIAIDKKKLSWAIGTVTQSNTHFFLIKAKNDTNTKRNIQKRSVIWNGGTPSESNV